MGIMSQRKIKSIVEVDLELKDIAVIWDLDGTLLDTYEWHYQSWHQILADVPNVFDREVYRKYFGRNNRQSVKRFLGYEPDEALFHDLVNRKETLFQQGLPKNTQLFPGVLTWLDYIRANGMKQSIGSSARIDNIDVSVDSFGIRGYFEFLVDGEGRPSKPKPDIFLEAAAMMGFPATYCVVFEDSFHGIQAAKAAGMVSVAKTGTFQFSDGQADIILPDYLLDPEPVFQEILGLVREHNTNQALL